MKELLLDASNWKTENDVYDSFFRAVGAPEWHGRNFDALRDSIAGGQINAVQVPYRAVVKNTGTISVDARTILEGFAELIRELAAEGCPVEIRME